jgi:hypothetical protein
LWAKYPENVGELGRWDNIGQHFRISPRNASSRRGIRNCCPIPSHQPRTEPSIGVEVICEKVLAGSPSFRVPSKSKDVWVAVRGVQEALADSPELCEQTFEDQREAFAAGSTLGAELARHDAQEAEHGATTRAREGQG